jgi:DNA-binding NtrC family response regulator
VTVRTLRGDERALPRTHPMSTQRSPASGDGPPGRFVVLIMSRDAVAAALLGALVETLGYLVRFFHPPELPTETLRRTRPAVAMIDCADPSLMSDEVLGPAKMRGISVVIFGARDALDRVRELAREHELDSLLMPASLETLDLTLKRAIGAEDPRASG